MDGAISQEGIKVHEAWTQDLYWVHGRYIDKHKKKKKVSSDYRPID